MRTFHGLDELEKAVGTHLGYSDWQTITQEQVNLFADATGDHQWIHVDPEKAAQGPFGTTIAHGYLTLSLVPSLVWQIYTVEGLRMGVNYGSNKVRFPAPVPVGSRVRGGAELLESCAGRRARRPRCGSPSSSRAATSLPASPRPSRSWSTDARAAHRRRRPARPGPDPVRDVLRVRPAGCGDRSAACGGDRRRQVQPHLRGHRRRAPVDRAPAAARSRAGDRARHGPRVPGDDGAPADRRPGARDVRPVRGPRRARRPVLRDGAGGGDAVPARLPARAPRGRAHRRHLGPDGRHPRGAAPRRPGRGRARTSGVRRASWPARYGAGRSSSTPRGAGTCAGPTSSSRASRSACPRSPRPASCTATTGSTTCSSTTATGSPR